MFSPFDLYFVFCMFVLIRPIFVSTVCEVFSTLRAGDTQGKLYFMIYRDLLSYSSYSRHAGAGLIILIQNSNTPIVNTIKKQPINFRFFFSFFSFFFRA